MIKINPETQKTRRERLATVIAIAAFRLPFMRGNILEQNIARTTASVSGRPSSTGRPP